MNSSLLWWESTQLWPCKLGRWTQSALVRDYCLTWHRSILRTLHLFNGLLEDYSVMKHFLSKVVLSHMHLLLTLVWLLWRPPSSRTVVATLDSITNKLVFSWAKISMEGTMKALSWTRPMWNGSLMLLLMVRCQLKTYYKGSDCLVISSLSA